MQLHKHGAILEAGLVVAATMARPAAADRTAIREGSG